MNEPAPKKPTAVSYPELSDAEKTKLNGKLLDFPYVSGYTPSQEDVFYFVQIKNVDDKLVNLARWWRNIASYESEFASLPGEPKLPGASASFAKEEVEEDEDIDLFGDSEDEDEAAEQERIKAERVAAYNAKKAAKEDKKGKIIAKSNIILDIKPWSDETDMKVLESEVRKITIDGLLWGTGKLVAIGYGIKKLQITTVVEDDKVSTEDLEDQITALEDYVQSVDIVAFNKI